MISGGPTEKDNANARKMSLKRARYKMLSGYLRPKKERYFTVAFS